MINMGARYGIWGENPYGPDVGSIALDTAKSVGDLFNQNEQNRQLALKNQFYPQEMNSGMDLRNAMMQHLDAQSQAELAQAQYDRMRAGLGIQGLMAQSGNPNVGAPGPSQSVNSLESPTTSSATTAQTRDTAEAEMKNIFPTVQKGLSHYVGPTGTFSLLKDLTVSNINPNSDAGKAASQRLYEYNLAKRYSTELAAINARQATGQAPGVEAVREFQKSMLGNSLLIPQSVQVKALNNYPGVQQQAVDAAIQQERQGFPRTGPVPPWSQGGIQLNPMGGSNRSSFHQGIIPNPAPNTSSSSTQQQFTMPQFGSKEEFQSWYKGLNADDRAKVKAELGRSK